MGADGSGPEHTLGAWLGPQADDGRAAATWGVHRDGDRATLRVGTLAPLAAADRDAVAAEGARLLAFLTGDVPSRRVEVAECL